MTSKQQKRYRDRAVRAQRALAAEKAKYGEISDGSGKRYRIGVYFLLAGELARAVADFDAFEAAFPDDTGEPVFHLYSALAAYRAGDMHKARTRLRATVCSNLYLVPYLLGETLPVADVWHGSNWEEPAYLDRIVEFLDEPTADERRWLASEWYSPAFTKLKERYIATFSALKGERNLLRRLAILLQWQRWWAR